MPKLWYYKGSCLRVPNLCIHLSKSQDFEPDLETHLRPVFATYLIDTLCGTNGDDIKDKHPHVLLEAIAKDLACTIDDIVDFELNIIDTQPARLGGFHREFIYSGRQDNLNSTITTVDALIEAGPETQNEVSMALLFDHEEVGSKSAQGGGSNIVNEIPYRIFNDFCKNAILEDYYIALRHSFFLSVDLNHCVHPNYPEKLQQSHRPILNNGVLIHYNARQSFASDCVGTGILWELSNKVNVPLQAIMYRNDSMSGSTIGPMIAAKSGIKTIDIGMSLINAHSVRECCGVMDLLYQKKLTTSFFKNYASIKHNMMST